MLRVKYVHNPLYGIVLFTLHNKSTIETDCNRDYSEALWWGNINVASLDFFSIKCGLSDQGIGLIV